MTIDYAELEAAYPPKRKPCDGPWDNQCAIRMSIALEGAKFSLANYTDPRCSHGHARGAESLANYLWNNLARPKIFNPTGAKNTLQGKRGIIFFKDLGDDGVYDHIDCWNGIKTKTGEYFDECKEVWFFSLG